MNEPPPNHKDSRARVAIEAASPDVYTDLVTFPAVRVPIQEDRHVTCIVHAGPIDQIRDVDVVVSSENIYFEMAKPFKPSTSGRLRRAAAKKNAAGEITEDITFDELNDWMHQHGRHGLPVSPGTVVATSSGELARRGICRIYHAAIVTPKPGTNEYDVDSHTVAQAVHGIFELARAQGETGIPVQSVCLPLFGAGRGRMDARTSFEAIWSSLMHEITQHPDDDWEIHFSTWKKPETEYLLTTLRGMATSI